MSISLVCWIVGQAFHDLSVRCSAWAKANADHSTGAMARRRMMAVIVLFRSQDLRRRLSVLDKGFASGDLESDPVDLPRRVTKTRKLGSGGRAAHAARLAPRPLRRSVSVSWSEHQTRLRRR